MKQLHHPKDSRKYTKGANFDVDKEFLTLSEGHYLDARNMRNLSMDGTNGAMKKIGGMESLYPNINNNCIDGNSLQFPNTYVCIGARVVNGNIIEFWADENEVLPSYIRINGQVVLISDDFPITYNHPLQMDINESCIGGEIYVTDFNVEPMIFNIEDLMSNSGMLSGTDCTTKYFTDFNIDLYTLSLNRALNHPVFIKLDASGGGYTDILYGDGLPVGYVTYSFRFATDAGDRTTWSAPTNLIPTVKRLTSGNEPNFPHLQTISKPADISIPSVYGAHIKLRIDNSSDYEFIELRRDFWYSEDPIGNPPISEIIAKLSVVPSELSVRNILDKGKEAEEVIGGDELIEVIASIKRAKAIRYFNNTLYLMNIEYESRNISDTLTYSGGNDKMYPCVENMDVRGHGEPHNGAHYKSLMRGERYGWGLILWDAQGNYSFADKIDGFENFLMPNRRDATSSLTEEVSYFDTVRAANTSGAVTQTHEVFDLIGATSKLDSCSYINILDDTIFGFVSNNKPVLSGVTLSLGVDWLVISEGCISAVTEGLDNGAGRVVAGDLNYRPYYPTGQDDTTNFSLDYRVNISAFNNGVSSRYDAQAFSPRYFSMGMTLDGVGGFPQWAKAFSVVRTTPANKVAAQGLGFYSMTSGELVSIAEPNGVNVSKAKNELWVYMPDADDNHGVSNIVESLLSDSSPYGIQLASPLGFHTEVYSFDNDTLRDTMSDIVTWCRLLNDGEDAAARINPDENPNMGILDGTTSDRFVAYGKWRASTQFSPQHNLGGNGNFIYDIDDIQEITVGRAKYLKIRTVQDIYFQDTTDPTRFDGQDSQIQNWHEPIYMVNIISRNAVVPDNNTTQYQYTGNYVKLESLIGVSNGDDTNSYELVDERWEDCIQSISGGTSVYNTYLRFCWIENTNGEKRRWLNITDLNPLQITTALNDLETNGFHDIIDVTGSYRIYGLYSSSESTDGVHTNYSLVFNYFNIGFSKQYQVPPLGESIYICYDSRIPVRVFGGDTWIGDTMCAWQDNQYDDSGELASGSGGVDDFVLNVAFPYRGYTLNPRIFIVKRSKDIGVLLGGIQQKEGFEFRDQFGGRRSRVRQLTSNFIVESRVNLNYAFNNEDPKHSSEQWFPLKNYVMRPNRWDASKIGTGIAEEVYDDNNIIAEYEDDYGDEFLLWQYGGLRFFNLATSVPLINLDYTKSDNTKQFTSTPKLGFEEQNLYCTRVHWSIKRPPNIQDSPTVRTFPSSNTYDISDDTGEINFSYSSISSKGNNIYAFTEGGTCMLLVDKRIIHEINAEELATVGSDIGGILNELWITRDTGMSGETWRSAAEHDNKLWFVNHKSAYLFDNNQLADIARTGYHSKIYPNYLDGMSDDYSHKLVSVYDELHDEYWVTFSEYSVPRGYIPSPTLVFGNIQEMWIGGFDYNFDQYVTIDNDTYGINEVGTFLLNQGNTIDGNIIISELINISVGDVAYEDKAPVDNRSMDKEFLRVRVNSNIEPTSIEFFNDFDQYSLGNVQALIDNVANPLAMKNYYGFEGYIPRKTDLPKNRMQGRLLIYNIINIFDEGFKITTTDIQYKKLK